MPLQVEMSMLMTKNVVFDLDGTLSDHSWREGLIARDDEHRPNWQRYHQEAQHDMPVEPVAELYRTLYAAGYGMVITTMRPLTMHYNTVSWLVQHKLNFHILLMRPDEDFSPTRPLKLKLIRQCSLTPKNTLFIFDNDAGMGDMLRNFGYYVVRMT